MRNQGPACQCGRPIPFGLCDYCDLRDALGLDVRGGYGSEPEGTYAALVMARPVRVAPRSMRRDVAARRRAEASGASEGPPVKRAA